MLPENEERKYILGCVLMLALMLAYIGAFNLPLPLG
jgi:hypothetical protein